MPAFELPSAAARAETLLGRSEPSPARDALAEAWPLPTAEARLLHGDYWPCNVLWNEGEIAGIIDWEDAATGDPLSDLAICRLDLTLIVGVDVRDAFTIHYLEATATEPAALPHWDLVAAIHAAPHLDEWAAGWLARGYAHLDAAAFLRDHTAFVRAARDAIEAS